MLLMIVLQESFDFSFDIVRNYRVPFYKVRKKGHFLVKMGLFYVNILNYWGNISDSEWVKTDSNDHPHNREHLFLQSFQAYISIAHSCERLSSPAHSKEILAGRLILKHIISDNPGIFWEI